MKQVYEKPQVEVLNLRTEGKILSGSVLQAARSNYSGVDEEEEWN